MKKYEVLNTIQREKIVAIIREKSEYQAEKAVDALLNGGINCIELTFTTPFAHTILEKLSKQYANTKVHLGAGTVLDAQTARAAILSGAKYLITPSLNTEVIKLSNRFGVPVIPGVFTPTEAITALEAGADVVKLFPASQFSKSIIKDLKAPFPNLEIMPTGGINEKNLSEWLLAGAFACGVGGSLLSGIESDNYAEITQKAKKLIEIIK